MTCPTCKGIGARMIRCHACACLVCFGTGGTPEPASAELVARRLHRHALEQSTRDPYRALLCLQAAVVLLGVTGAPSRRLDGLARQGMAIALVRGAREDVEAFLLDVERYVDGRTQSAMIGQMLHVRLARSERREPEIAEVIRG